MLAPEQLFASICIMVGHKSISIDSLRRCFPNANRKEGFPVCGDGRLYVFPRRCIPLSWRAHRFFIAQPKCHKCQHLASFHCTLEAFSLSTIYSVAGSTDRTANLVFRHRPPFQQRSRKRLGCVSNSSRVCLFEFNNNNISIHIRTLITWSGKSRLLFLCALPMFFHLARLATNPRGL